MAAPLMTTSIGFSVINDGIGLVPISINNSNRAKLSNSSRRRGGVLTDVPGDGDFFVSNFVLMFAGARLFVVWVFCLFELLFFYSKCLKGMKLYRHFSAAFFNLVSEGSRFLFISFCSLFSVVVSRVLFVFAYVSFW